MNYISRVKTIFKNVYFLIFIFIALFLLTKNNMLGWSVIILYLQFIFIIFIYFFQENKTDNQECHAEINKLKVEKQEYKIKLNARDLEIKEYKNTIIELKYAMQNYRNTLRITKEELSKTRE